jgi:hypothetical protein
LSELFYEDVIRQKNSCLLDEQWLSVGFGETSYPFGENASKLIDVLYEES